MQEKDLTLVAQPIGELRYAPDCTVAAPHEGVATPWNRVTIPRRDALPCTTANAHSAPSNRSS